MMAPALAPSFALHEGAHLLVNLQDFLLSQRFSKQFLIVLQKPRVSDILFRTPKSLLFIYFSSLWQNFNKILTFFLLWQIDMNFLKESLEKANALKGIDKSFIMARHVLI